MYPATQPVPLQGLVSKNALKMAIVPMATCALKVFANNRVLQQVVVMVKRATPSTKFVEQPVLLAFRVNVLQT
jgi:hypothetical protein